MTTQRQNLRQLFRQMIFPKPLQPKDWERPTDSAVYDQQLHEQGFIAPARWKDSPLDVTPNKAIMSDLTVLEKYLMPVFWNFNQKATHYQARYLYYQRIFLVAALITTLISVVNSFVLAVDTTFSEKLPTLVAAIGIQMQVAEGVSLARNLSIILGILTAVISARASYYTLISNYGLPRQRWSHYRRLTEELRITYFKFLAHLDPFSGPQRVYNLRQEVLKLRQQEQENG